MGRATRARESAAAHPRILDVALSLAVFVLAVVSPAGAGQPRGHPAEAVALVAAACAALALRRTAPWTVWALTTALAVVGVVVVGGPCQTILPAIVAVYTVSSRSPARQAIAAVVVTALLTTVVTLAVGYHSWEDALAYGLVAWAGLAAVSGIAVRYQRELVAGLQERARQAELTREEEAQRRVAQERVSIARDLHDLVAHHVSVINVQAGVALHLLESQPSAAAQALAHVRAASDEAVHEMADLVGLLRTGSGSAEITRTPAPRLADLPHLVSVADRAGLHVVHHTVGAPAARISPSLELTAYRIVQEAFTNAMRHGSGSAELVVMHDADGSTIEVRNPLPRRPRVRADTDDDRIHHGVVGMHERAAVAGATLYVGPAGDGSWVVRLSIGGLVRPAADFASGPL